MEYQSTRQAAKRLGISNSRLARAIWDERFLAPTKGPGGAFIWTEADLQRASWALLGHDLDEVASGQGAKHVE
jgi:hypothetical protein